MLRPAPIVWSRANLANVLRLLSLRGDLAGGCLEEDEEEEEAVV